MTVPEFPAPTPRTLDAHPDHLGLDELPSADAFQDELTFLGIESSPAFVRAPEGNGCVERLNRTLKEQLLWLRPFRNVEELRLALLEWKDRYNRTWLIERHGYLTPEQARRQHEEGAKLVA